MNTVGIRLNIVYASLIIIGLIFSGQSFAEIDSKSIVGVWLFDEGSGKIAKDSSGIGNDGELMNNPKWVEGKFGKALEFDGKDDCVEGKIDITTTNLTIGTGNVGFYTGSIDEVAIFNVVLGEDDFKSIITKGLKAISVVFPAGKLTTTWGSIKR